MSVEVEEKSVAARPLRETKSLEPAVTPAFILQDARQLLTGLWLGASLFFSFAVAPSAFAVLRDSTVLYANHLAGSIVTRNLAIINTTGFILGILLLASAFLFRKGVGRAALTVELISLAVLTILTGIGHWVIAARMLALRQQMGRPIDETVATDPLRVSFNSLHGYSVGALIAAMLAALVAFILIARRARVSQGSEAGD